MNMASVFQMGTQEAEKSVWATQHAFIFFPGIPFVRRTVGLFFACGVKTQGV